jgi:2-polyprenyl-3-methyl-5-hydroxy-6-metoxy-1,4-benzoquinol methylase
MTCRWTRHATLSPVDGAADETWEITDEAGRTTNFPVRVRTGKPLDIMALRGIDTAEHLSYAEHLRSTAERLYGPGQPRRHVDACPCCDAPTQDAPVRLSVFGVDYHTCTLCAHVFVRSQPSPEAMESLFRESDEHSATYTDAAAAELRMAQIAAPKLEWARDVFKERFGRPAGRFLDVGAGAGHFVAAVRKAGLEAEGYELSRSSCEFASRTFDIELRRGDFLVQSPQPGAFDVVTLWGVLEYAPDPIALLRAARRWLAPSDGMLVVEVPRSDAFGTALQGSFSDTVARHMDPTSHLNAFSDASLMTALWRAGFAPLAAWYFGMDVYELVTQLAVRLPDATDLDLIAAALLRTQGALDAARLCDDIVVAAVAV